MAEFKHLVRIQNTDLIGEKPINMALRKIKGVNFMIANAICSVAKIPKNKKTGELSDEEVNKINSIVKDPLDNKIPLWMFNRRRDPSTGKDTHLIAAELDFTRDNDIKMMKKMRCYKGVRHIYGLPVRGQRTKSNFRKNKGKVSLGVKKREGVKAGRV